MAALFSGASNDLPAWIGIGAGTYAAGRAVLLPGDLPELYIDGYSAARCLVAQGDLFVGDVAELRAQRFQEGVQNLRLLAERGREAFGRVRLSAAASRQQREEFQAALTELSQATATADQVLTAAAAELFAYDAAESAFERTLADIHVQVAKRARSGRAVDFAQTQTSIAGLVTGLIQPTEEMEPQAEALADLPDRGDEEIIQELRRLAARIAMTSASVSASMPSYASVVEAVADCPGIVV